MKQLSKILLSLAVVLPLLSAGSAQAAITMDMVTIGNALNNSDTTGFGFVRYDYDIGKYEVTAAQYTAFLNSVAATDTFGLYDIGMWTALQGCKIQRSGVSGSYAYSVASDYADRPVNLVSWGDAARFANWMTNGQPIGAQDLSTTEDGSYFLNGANTDAALMAVLRKADATWVIPSEDEWYKAAYHKNDGATNNYWDYPTQTDSPAVPGRDLTETTNPGNNANYYGDPYPIDSPYYTTTVGEFELSASAYGTFDQGGNVFEWNEGIMGDSTRVVRGAGWGTSSALSLSVDVRNGFVPTTTDRSDFGFRLAKVPPQAPVAPWTPGTPVVGFWGPHPLTDQIAQRDVVGGYNVDWAASLSEVDKAGQYGLRALYVDSLLSPESLDGGVKQAQLDELIDQYKTYPAAYAYYIADEPTTEAQIDNLAPLIAYVRARDPDRLAYLNMGAPSWTGDALWQHYISTVHPQLLSYDSYNLLKTESGANYDDPSYLYNLGKVSGWAKANNIPFMNIVQACAWDPTTWRVPNEQELRFLVYSTLAYGAQDICYFNYNTNAPNTGGIEFNPDGTPTPVYTALATLNPEFVKVATQYQSLKWIGAYLKGYYSGSMPPGAEALPASSPFDVPGVTNTMRYNTGDALKGLLFGLFDLDGNTAADATVVLVENLDYSTGKTYTLTGPGPLSIFDATTGIWTATGHNYATLNLLPGGGILVGVTAAITVPVSWTGSATTTWSAVVGSGNWNRASGATGDYIDGADVTFDDSAFGTTTVDISAANVTPHSVTFNNSSKTYIVGGSFGIAGSTGVLKQGPGTVTMTSPNTYSGTTTVQAGTLELGESAQAPVLSLAGGADIQGGQLVLDYSTTAPDVLTPLKASHDAGWVTGQIRNTTAGTTGLVLGWKQSATQVTVMATLPGDADLNGSITGADLSLLLSKYNLAGTWSVGDFNYDGSVTGADLSLLLSNYNQSIPAPVAAAAVPEPGVFVLLAIGAISLLAHVWRKQR